MRIHVDGVCQGELFVGPLQVGNDLPLYLSFNDEGGYPYYLQGDLDEVAIYDRALSLSEIQDHYENGLPTNHPPIALCQDVTVEAGPGCVADADVDGGSSDPDGDTLTIFQSPPGPYPLGLTVVTLLVTDEYGESDSCTATVTVVDTMPPIILWASVAPQLVEVGETVNFDAEVADDECELTGEWDFGDDNTSSSIIATHSYADSGVYAATLKVTDQGNNSSSSEEFMVVVYDSSGGFVTGGGWIDSPVDDKYEYMQAGGKASFGFVARYKKGANEPDGNTEFQFKAGNLNLHSTSYQWLVVTGSNYARFKGTGTINGDGPYKFMLWAGDDVADTFRIKIWWEDGEIENVVYDNGMDQAIGGGSIVIHTK